MTRRAQIVALLASLCSAAEAGTIVKFAEVELGSATHPAERLKRNEPLVRSVTFSPSGRLIGIVLDVSKTEGKYSSRLVVMESNQPYRIVAANDIGESSPAAPGPIAWSPEELRWSQDEMRVILRGKVFGRYGTVDCGDGDAQAFVGTDGVLTSIHHPVSGVSGWETANTLEIIGPGCSDVHPVDVGRGWILLDYAAARNLGLFSRYPGAPASER